MRLCTEQSKGYKVFHFSSVFHTAGQEHPPVTMGYLSDLHSIHPIAAEGIRKTGSTRPTLAKVHIFNVYMVDGYNVRVLMRYA